MALTDLEICKRLAEIEGLIVSKDVKPSCGGAFASIHPNGCYGVYNPLTDDTLCFKFCYEDGIVVKKSYDKVNGKMVWSGRYYAHHPENRGRGTIDENPNKAVCLEKIKVHGL